MQQYKISEESYKKFRKKWFNIGIPVISAVVAIVTMIAIYSHREDDGFNPLPIVIPVMAAVITFSIIRGLKRQRRLLMSYSLTISDSDITRDQLNTPPLAINFMEIKEIVKTKKGGFMIKGRTRTDVIYIPYIIDNAEALEEQLQRFAPVIPNATESRQRGLLLGLALLSAVAFVTLYLTDNKVIAVIAGVVVCGTFVYRTVVLLTNKSVPTNLKRRSVVYLIVVAFVIYTLYTKLMVV